MTEILYLQLRGDLQMSRMHAPISVRRARFEKTAASSNLKGLNYLLKHLKSLVISDKYPLDNNMLILNVEVSTTKALIKKAFSSVMPDNKLISVNSLVKKGTSRNFRGVKGNTSSFKRMYIKFEKVVDSDFFARSGGFE